MTLTFSKGTAVSLLRTCMLWLSVCVLIPACANQYAAAAYPTMSRSEYIDRLRAANDC